MLTNPFRLKGRWYKANLHTHTTASDGRRSLAERVAEYRDQGYAVLAITDHGKTNLLDGFSSRKFLVISGIELHPKCPGAPVDYHLVALGVPSDFRVRATAGPNTMIRRVRAVGGEVIVAHPYWCGHDMTHLGPLKRYVGVEVYNGTCAFTGHGVSSVHWDQLLGSGRVVGGSACDDAHRDDDRFMGWTWLRLPRLTVRAVLHALRTGAYYASCGPRIHDFQVRRGRATLVCDPAAEIRFIGRAYRGRPFQAAPGSPLTEAACDVTRDWAYVRAEVVDAHGRAAWTNPIVL